MRGDYAIGVDLGGTQVKYVVVTPAGEILRQLSGRTDGFTNTDGPPSDLPWINPIRAALSQLQEDQGQTASFIGLAAPGLAAGDSRSIAYMPGRMQWLEGLNWTDALQSPIPVPVLNDSQAALLGEVWLGSARGLSEVILLTLGTGVGGAILSGGRLLKGHIGRAGHLGHLSLNTEGAPDICGTPGSLEDAIGECTLRVRSGGRYGFTRDLVQDYEQGDEEAAVVWLRSVWALACGIASLINILDPEALVIGGGIAAAGSRLFDPLNKMMDKVEWRPGGRHVHILQAAAGDYAGALGAACYAIRGGTVG